MFVSDALLFKETQPYVFNHFTASLELQRTTADMVHQQLTDGLLQTLPVLRPTEYLSGRFQLIELRKGACRLMMDQLISRPLLQPRWERISREFNILCLLVNKIKRVQSSC